MTREELLRLAVKDILVAMTCIDPEFDEFFTGLVEEDDDLRWIRLVVAGGLSLQDALDTYLKDELESRLAEEIKRADELYTLNEMMRAQIKADALRLEECEKDVEV